MCLDRYLIFVRKPIFLIIIIFLFVNLLTLPHYGFTWDEFGALNSGLINLQKIMGSEIDWYPASQAYGPLSETLYSASYLIFYQTLRLLPPDVAFHLPIVLFGTLCLLILYLFANKFLSSIAAFFTVLFFMILPRFIGHLHNNPRDIPLMTLFSLSMLFYTHALLRNNLWSWIFAGLTAGVTLSQKINALEIFPIVFFTIVFRQFLLKKFCLKRLIYQELLLVISFIVCLITAFLLWPRLWENPFGQIIQLVSHFSQTWRGNTVPYLGNMYMAGINVPWHYALVFLAITTPLPILFFVLFGFLKSLIILKMNSKNAWIYVLILLWFSLPTLKYIYPRAIVYDDIRQYLEALPALMLLAGIGGEFIWLFLKKINIYLALMIISLAVSHATTVFYRYHPYETSYFNALVGGLKGASKLSFDPDFWGNPLKEGYLMLNKLAKPNSSVNIPLAGQTAGFYLRPDLKINENGLFDSDYVVLLNRPSVFWLNNNIYYYQRNRKPIYSVTRDDTPLLFIYEKNGN